MNARKSKEAEPVVVNPALRAWTRGVSFTLAMGKTQVVTLVAMHLSQDAAEIVGTFHHPALKHFVTASHGLQDRGLVVHHPINNPSDWSARKKFREFFEITPAGEHVVALLKLTGIYAELEEMLRAPVTPSLRRLA